MMTTLIVVCAVAVVALFGIYAGIPMWMIHRRPDTAPHDELPQYLRTDWENLPVQALAAAGQKG
jgi:hypothetical protein